MRRETVPVDPSALSRLNAVLEKRDARQRVAWALDYSSQLVLSSSFGAQSAVMLHLVTQQAPGIPVVLIDTGYLFPETYQFIDELTTRFALNIKVYRPEYSAAWQEARHGRLWERGLEGLEEYNRINKIEPMKRALNDFAPEVWFAGIRRSQASSRRDLGVLEQRYYDIVKVHPIIDWTDRDIHRYVKRHRLPYHPLWHQGYVSIGDVHTTRPLTDGIHPEETRFFGVKRECGLHEL